MATEIKTWEIIDGELTEINTTLAQNGRKEKDNLVINKAQRLLLVDFSIDEALSRMIEWLSSKYDVGINAIILNYVKTSESTWARGQSWGIYGTRKWMCRSTMPITIFWKH